MKTLQRLFAASLAVPLFAGGLLPAQQRPGPPSGNRDAGRNSVVRSFERNAPAIGSMIPDVRGYTADGKPFSLRDLKGQYTVLVFGCLT